MTKKKRRNTKKKKKIEQKNEHKRKTTEWLEENECKRREIEKKNLIKWYIWLWRKKKRRVKQRSGNIKLEKKKQNK